MFTEKQTGACSVSSPIITIADGDLQSCVHSTDEYFWLWLKMQHWMLYYSHLWLVCIIFLLPRCNLNKCCLKGSWFFLWLRSSRCEWKLKHLFDHCWNLWNFHLGCSSYLEADWGLFLLGFEIDIYFLGNSNTSPFVSPSNFRFCLFIFFSTIFLVF